MHPHSTSILLICYGSFLILCGIISVGFIGKKAKTALLSGGTSGLICIGLGYLMTRKLEWVFPAALFVNSALIIVFGWRATKTLFAIFEMLELKQGDVKKKGIAFMIISLMCVVSVFCLILQIIL